MWKAKTAATWLLVGWLIPFITGCSDMADYTLTGHLWDETGGANHSEPAPYPNMRLYQAADHKDFLVLYDEVHMNDVVIKRRAYLLKTNEKRIEAGRRPHFLSAPDTASLQAVTILTNSAAETNVVPAAGLVAVLQPDQRHFTLVSNGGEIGVFYLPAYVNQGDRAWRVAATPFTVTADVAIYAGVVALVVGLAYLAATQASQ